MGKPKDHSGLIEQNIRKLELYLNSPLEYEDFQDLLYEASVVYASDNPGDYYISFPGIILPLFS